MLTGVSKKQVIPYVPEDDRDSPIDIQTVFWIKPKGFGDGNSTAARYAGCRKPLGGRGGYDDYSVSKMNKADIEEFIAIIVQVENYKLSADHDGQIITDTEDTDDLRKICKDMSNDLFNELIDVAGDMSKLKAGEKKSLNSSSTLIVGKQKSQKDKKSMTVTSVD